MTEQLHYYMEKAFHYEECGCFEEAVLLCNKCVQVFPEYQDDIEFEIAKMMYRNGKAEEALTRFLMLYQKTGQDEIGNLILEAYYFNRQQEFDKRYQENCKRLEAYPHFFGTIHSSGLRYCPILEGENLIWYFDNVERVIKTIERCKISLEEPLDSVCIVNDLLWMEDILLSEKMTRKTKPFMDQENPLLFVYRKEAWELLLQLLDLKEIIEFDRIVFYNDLNQLGLSLIEEEVRFPEMTLGDVPDEIIKVLVEAKAKYRENFMKYKEEALDYYEENGEKVLKNIQEGTPKILFVTSRFTTALQYHIRDCMAAAENMGLETTLIIEKDRLHMGHTGITFLKSIAEFKPDVIFIIDHFRYEYIEFLEGLDKIVWVSWIQDPLPRIFSEETVKKQKENDVVISCFGQWEEFEKLGYNEERLIRYPLVASHKIYHPYVLSESERMQYECDICMICHACDADGHVKRFVEKFSGETRLFVRDLYQSYIDHVRAVNQVFRKVEEFQAFIQEFAKRFGCGVDADFADYIADDMWRNLSPRLYRALTADWLIDAGYTNIKLWGKEWKDNEKYKPYAMGAAENGETLSKILQASKIVVGNNAVASGTSRVPETMLSGAFYMECFVPPEADMTDRGQLEEGKELVLFSDKEDFLNKVQFYLNNEDERVRMAKVGREKALDKLTYQGFMKHVITGIGKMFS